MLIMDLLNSPPHHDWIVCEYNVDIRDSIRGLKGSEDGGILGGIGGLNIAQLCMDLHA